VTSPTSDNGYVDITGPLKTPVKSDIKFYIVLLNLKKAAIRLMFTYYVVTVTFVVCVLEVRNIAKFTLSRTRINLTHFSKKEYLILCRIQMSRPTLHVTRSYTSNSEHRQIRASMDYGTILKAPKMFR